MLYQLGGSYLYMLMMFYRWISDIHVYLLILFPTSNKILYVL